MIDTKKHAKEIGRHLRNGNYELTEGGVLIDAGGMNALANGAFRDTLYRGGELDTGISPNTVVTEGLVHMLNVIFAGVAPITQWYIGLFSGNVQPQADWKGSDVTAKSTELQAGYDGPRKEFDVDPTTTASIGNVGSEAMFEFAAGGPYTARGAFIASASAKGAQTGVLFAATRFAADRANLAQPDKLGVSYTVTAQDGG